MISGDQIAADALRYRGHPYVYGVWDCSGFVNHVLGSDLGIPLPGGIRGFRGPPPHGPAVDDYLSWGLPVTSPARGDLVLFAGLGPNGHIGIVLGPNQMISALDPAQGTIVTPIQGYGPPGAPISYRRAVGTTKGTGAPGAAPAAPSGPGAAQSAGTAVLVVGAMVGAVLLGATVVGVATAAAGAWLLSRAAHSG